MNDALASDVGVSVRVLVFVRDVWVRSGIYTYTVCNCYCVVIGCKSVSSVPSSACSRCFDY